MATSNKNWNRVYEAEPAPAPINGALIMLGIVLIAIVGLGILSMLPAPSINGSILDSIISALGAL